MNLICVFEKEELEKMYAGEIIEHKDSRGKCKYMSEARYKAYNGESEFKPYENPILNEAVDMGFLQDWYLNSVDTTQDPVWTDEHLRELTEDFYVIPKEAVKQEYDFRKVEKERAYKNLSMSISFIENQIRGVDDRRKRVHYEIALMAMREKLKEVEY